MYEIVLSLLVSHSAPGAVPSAELAQEIVRVSAQYELDPVLVTRIILTESRGLASAINQRTADYGLMQINIKTAAAYNVSIRDLMQWRKNLTLGAKVLSKMNRTCRYNVGTARLDGARLDRCIRYEQKLASFN